MCNLATIGIIDLVFYPLHLTIIIFNFTPFCNLTAKEIQKQKLHAHTFSRNNT